MFGLHKPTMFRSTGGCCICRAKSSSSRFTDSQRYESSFQSCFGLDEVRSGDICNACVLLVKRWKKLPAGSKKTWNHVVDAKAGSSVKATLRTKTNRRPSQMSRAQSELKRNHSDAHHQHHLQCLARSVTQLQRPIRRGLGRGAFGWPRPFAGLLLPGPHLLEKAEGVLWDRVQGTPRRSPHPSPPVHALLPEGATTAPAAGRRGGRAATGEGCSELQVSTAPARTRRGGGGRPRVGMDRPADARHATVTQVVPAL